MKRLITNKIIVHCTATEAGNDYPISEIAKWHRLRGWRTVGYHYVVHLNGVVSIGRPEAEVGAHCKGQNDFSIGVCYVGGLIDGKPADTRTDAQKRSLQRLLARLKHKYGAEVYGHCDFANKACPCFDARAEYKDL